MSYAIISIFIRRSWTNRGCRYKIQVVDNAGFHSMNWITDCSIITWINKYADCWCNILLYNIIMKELLNTNLIFRVRWLFDKQYNLTKWSIVILHVYSKDHLVNALFFLSIIDYFLSSRKYFIPRWPVVYR